MFLGCNFQGTLPTEYGRWSLLQEINASQNDLSGGLPTEYSAWVDMRRFRMFGNRFHGPFPSEYSTWLLVEEINVSDNYLNGTISFDFPALSIARVHNNLFTSLDVDALVKTAVVTLNLDNNPLDVFPSDIVSSQYLTVLTLSETNLQLDISDLPMNSPNVPVLRLSSNPEVTGSIGALARPSHGGSSAYVDIDISNTSVSGTFDEFVPLEIEALNDNLYFSLANVMSFSVADNERITGSLPVGWFRYAENRGQPLTLNVTNVPGLHFNFSGLSNFDCPMLIEYGLPFDCLAPLQSYTDEAYVCRPLQWPDGTRVIGLAASYFDYHTCQCSPGFEGTPPHCQLRDRTALIIGISVSFGIAALVGIVLGSRQVIRWRRMVIDVRHAKAILAQSADRYGVSIYAAAGSASGSGSTSLTTALLLERQQRQPSGIDRDWIVRYDDVHIVETVARGSQGKVSMALWNRTRVALKEFNTTSDAEKESLLSEALLHVRLRHPNIVQLLGVCIDPVCTLTEWMDCGSLFNVLHNSPERVASIYDVARDIARGMLYLHGQGVVHRDLKSLNVMLDSRGTAKVGDFGLARKWNEGESATMTMCQGTPHWMAPEVFRGDGYDSKCDVYSFGIILWELVTKQMPFPEMQFGREVEEFVSGGGRPAVSECVGHSELVGLMQRCWSGDAAQRPTFDAIVDELEGMGS